MFKNMWLFVLIFPLFFTVAFRADTVGNDTISYQRLYNAVIHSPFLSIITDFSKDIGFSVLMFLCGQLHFSYFDFQVLIAAVTYLALFFYLKKHSQNYGLSILVFMCILGYFESMNIIRQILSCMLAINAIDLYQNNKKIKYTISILLLASIHRSSLIFLLLLPSEKIRKLGFISKLGVVSLGILAYLFTNKILQGLSIFVGRYEHLIDSKYTQDNGFFGMLILICFTLLFIFLEMNQHRVEVPKTTYCTANSPLIKRQHICLFCYSVCFIFLCLGFGFGLANRIIIGPMLLFMETITARPNYKMVFLIKSGTVCLLIFYYILVMVTRNYWHGTIPYALQPL